MRTILPVLCFCMLLMACGKEAEPVNKIVGTWKVENVKKYDKVFTPTDVSGSFNYNSVVFYADKTMELIISNPASVVTGTWDVVQETHTGTDANGNACTSSELRLYITWNGGGPAHVGNNQISKLSNDKLVFYDDKVQPNIIFTCSR